MRLRVLLIAEACNPTWTSVPLVGYSMSRALASHPELEVTLVTHVRNREGLKGDPLHHKADIVYIDNEWVAKPLYTLSKLIRGGQTLSWTIDTAMSWPSYMVFELQVHHHFQNQLLRRDFDLIHRVTPLTPTQGSPLAARTRVPMLIGPLNGGLPWPREYPELRRQEREWLVPLRGAYRYAPFYRSTYRHLAGVIAGSRHTATEIPSYFKGKRFYLPENGVNPERFPLSHDWPEPQGRFRFVTVGRLVPYKGTDLTIEAISQSPLLRSCEFVIIGDGPHRPELERLVQQHGLQDCVSFPGWVDQTKLGAELRKAQAFVFPSLREFGGGVVLEALASGLPSIIVDYGGPAELVTPACGTLLPLVPRVELVPQLRAAMEDLASNPERCRQLGAAACQQVRDNFVWEVKAKRVVEMYRELLGCQETGATVNQVAPASR